MSKEKEKYAMGVVNQLYDLSGTDPRVRQSINDTADDYMVERLETFCKQFPPEETKPEPTGAEIADEARRYNAANIEYMRAQDFAIYMINWYRQKIGR